jgi:hypothetical protein
MYETKEGYCDARESGSKASVYVTKKKLTSAVIWAVVE